MIIAIDGPAGAGKSTVAKELAKRLNFLYLDTGAMYRAVTLKVIRNNIGIDDEAKIVEIAKITSLDLKYNSDGLKVYLDGEDVTEQIRDPQVTSSVSEVSRIEPLRKILVENQRRIAKEYKNAVLEGRDIGTVVFPDADYKFYLDAELKERVRRRFRELKASGKEITIEEVERDILKRDRIDSNRKSSPLRKAEDAIYIDTTHLSISEVVERILSFISSY